MSVLATEEEVKRVTREWADDAGWALVKKMDTSLAFRRKGVSLFWEERVEAVVCPDGVHVDVSFIASGPRSRWGNEPPGLQRIAEAFVEGVSAELEGCRSPGTTGCSEARARMRTIQRWSRIVQYFVWALVPTWVVAACLAGWSNYYVAAVPGAVGTFVLALLLSQASFGMRPRRHIPITSLIMFSAIGLVLLVCAFYNLAY